MTVNVETHIDIARPRDLVSAYAVDPDATTRWYANISSVVWKTAPPLAVGTELEFVASFLGHRLAYTYRVMEWEPGVRFVMSTAQGPFPMETTYRWTDSAGGGTRMHLRNRGEPSGFSRVAAPLMATAMRTANRKDLALLKALLEDETSPSGS